MYRENVERRGCLVMRSVWISLAALITGGRSLGRFSMSPDWKEEGRQLVIEVVRDIVNSPHRH